MNDRDQIVTEDELNAYVDDELPADRRSAVEAWLLTHPDDAVRVAAWRKQAELIRERYGHLAYEAPPHRLTIERLNSSPLWANSIRCCRQPRGIPGRRRGWLDRA